MFKKIRYDDGRRVITFLGLKIFSYYKRKTSKEVQKEIRNYLKQINDVSNFIWRIHIEYVRGNLRAVLPKGRLEHYEFSVYSQNGEDGVIAEIIRRTGIDNRTFVEFGSADGSGSNTLYLLVQGWKGLWIEGNYKYYEVAKDRMKKYIEQNNLFVENKYIYPNNINEIISKYFDNVEIGVLSIDIDSYDYDVWKAIDCISPCIVVAEYNATYPPPVKWYLPYTKDYSGYHDDNYFGMSLSAANSLAKQKGYVLVGTEMNGSNAFFVRQDIFDKVKDRFPYPLDEVSLYNPPRYNSMPYYRGHKESFKYSKINDE